MTVREWEDSEACNLMYRLLETHVWIRQSMMTEKEKESFPSHKAAGGYLKAISLKEAWGNLWGNLADDKKALFTSLPNFDASIFKKITGIEVGAK